MTAVSGYVVTESDGAWTLLVLMLAVCIAGLGSKDR